ncbi:response regulator transcription factor [Stomatohabitans albus]|uniref:response regulator transcription factor n=1 Tax=Stomatohabitans albus TaxID=3110766 RepID=UPI00300CA597
MSGWEPLGSDDIPIVDLDDLPPIQWGEGADDAWGEDEPQSDGRIRLLLASPHPIVTEAMAWMLEGLRDDIDVIAEAHTPGELRILVADTRPSLVLLDGTYPDEDPVTIVRGLLLEHSELPIVLLADTDSSNDLRDALAAGVKGYLLKTTTGDEILLAIDKVRQGEVVVSNPLIGLLVDTIHPSGSGETLTRRELQVLDLLEKNMSDAQIAQVLSISIRTVQKHLTNMYRKCDVSNRDEMIAFARRRGVGLRY